MTETPSEQSAGLQALLITLGNSVLRHPQMVAIANFQYAWTLFVGPLQAHLNVEVAPIQVTFTFSWRLKHGWCRLKDIWWTRSGRELMLGLGSIMAGLGG